MPNWVDNNITITGAPEKVEALKKQVGASTQIPGIEYLRDSEGKIIHLSNGEIATEKKVHVENSPIFSFWNIVKPEEDQMDSYANQGWYDWNCANWGCKWDAGDVEVIDDSPGHWHIRFSTPWSTPSEGLTALSVQYPDLEIHNEWTEEQGYGAEDLYEDGVLHELRKWDIPESHEAHEEVWGDDSCPCTSYLDNEDEYPYEDCPRETMTTRLAVEQLEKISLTI